MLAFQYTNGAKETTFFLTGPQGDGWVRLHPPHIILHLLGGRCKILRRHRILHNKQTNEQTPCLFASFLSFVPSLSWEMRVFV